jgi:hypothetical protein
MNKKLLTSIVLCSCIVTQTFAISPYVKGYRLYIRYVKHIPKYGIKAPELLKKLNVNSTAQLQKLLRSGEIVEKIKTFNPAAAKGIEKILKKGKEKELEAFLIQIFQGHIPPGCN